MNAGTTELVPRAVCARCRRPEVVCYCRFVEEVPTRTRVVIFQHPRERDVPINTARIASLCLPASELHVGVSFSGTSTLDRLLADRERPPVLLYPGPDAIDVETSPPEGPVTLVVVDGTWWQARKLVQQNPELAALPRYAFRPAAPSAYRIRKEPRDEYVSTLEAIVHVLTVLEGDGSAVASLLEPFRAMVDAQVAYAESQSARPRHLAYRTRERRRADPADRLPPLLRERASDLVIVHAEANAWPYGTTQRGALADELVQCVAHRLSTGETFARFVAPRGPLAPSTARHLGVDEAKLREGDALEAFRVHWGAFLKPEDVLVTWGTYASTLLEGIELDVEQPTIDLRRAARLFAVSKVGTPENFLVERGLPPSPPLAEGRAGARLGQMAAICRHLTRT